MLMEIEDVGCEIITIGTSLGGLDALESLLSGLPPDFRSPIVIVQHRNAASSSGLAETLQLHTSLTVCEPVDKQPVEPGFVYLAPPDYHLLVEAGQLSLSTEAAVQAARPSIDVLFESAADSYRDGVTALLLTGASRDGTRGAAHVRASHGYVIAQDPAEAECGVMPKAAIEAGVVDAILPLQEIARALIARCRAPELARSAAPMSRS